MNIDEHQHKLVKTQSHQQIEQSLSYFEPIFLSEMKNVSLLDRIDTKYIFPISELYAILNQVENEYKVLTINQICLNSYHTVYFDEPEFTFYNQHHNNHATRYKVRTRQYIDTNLTFFEVKHKTNKKRTIKSRLPLNGAMRSQTAEVKEFVDSHVPVDSNRLESKLWNDYLRITLVGKSRPERVTIDIDLSFGRDQENADLHGIAIAEVKQAHFSQDSYFIQQMRQRGIRSSSFSKYCAGVYLLYEDVKTNNFKELMQKVDHLVGQEEYYANVS